MGAFALLVGISLLALGSLAWLVARDAWPGPIRLVPIDGKPVCVERLGSTPDGEWIRRSGRSDAWLLPKSAFATERPAGGSAAILLRDGRWFCSEAMELSEPGKVSRLPTRELTRWIEAFGDDKARLGSRARSGDTMAAAEFLRLHDRARLERIRLRVDDSVREIPVEEIRSLRPEDATVPERIGLWWQELGFQVESGPGSLAALTGTVLATLLATLMASPLAVAAAIWLSEFAPPGRLTWLFRHSVELLAGIPPVVFGAFGLVVLIRTAAPRLAPSFAVPSLLWASTTLAFLALPTVTRQAHLALSQVPAHLRKASLTCGATRLQTFLRIVLPAARRGLSAAILMGMVQALAETAPLLLTGAVQLAGHSLLDVQAPWLHVGGGFEHLGTRLYHGLEQFPPGPLGVGSGSLSCLLLAASAIALRTWASHLRHDRSLP
jgi:ABC-type phosphate transport system permease subunit